MKRTTILLLILVLTGIFAGCTENTNSFAGGERGKGAFAFTSDSSETEETYILNTASRRIHLPDCSYARRIAAENRMSVSDMKEAVAEGYTPCSRCLAEEKDTDIKKEETAK